MTTATPTAPKAAPAPEWLVPVHDLPTGGRMGCFTVAGDFYRAVLRDESQGWEHWEVAKELPDGTFARPYWVTVPVAGNDGLPVCTCDGFRFGGKCRHLCLRQLLARA